MSGREGTVYGTDYADLIGSTYVDAAGNSIGMFTDNDGTASPPDHIIVDAGASEDAIRMNFTEFPNVWRDYLTIVGGEGNDIIQLGDFVNVAAGTRILLDGGLGNDTLTGGAEADTFVIRGGQGSDVITDFNGDVLKFIDLPFASREAVVAALHERGFEVLPSAANFIFARHPQRDAAAIAAALREQGVIVRHFKQQRIAQFLRITIGTPEQNQALLDTLKALGV